MSAPDTNLNRQKKRHAPSLVGIRGAMVFGALMLVLALGYALSNGSSPGDRTPDAAGATLPASQ
ncbi:MAG: hypothetical protein AAF307_13070 [Pseudomonadota bacterium]